MKIGLVGYKGSGKSTLFQWLTGMEPDLSLSHTLQSAMAPIPEPRFEALKKIYNPKKITYAAMEIVDTPGLVRDQQGQNLQGNPQRLAQLREADALVWVVPAFDVTSPAKTDPAKTELAREIGAFKDDVVLADLEIVLNRIEKVTEQNKRPVPKSEHDRFEFELETLKLLQEGLESGTPLKDDQLTLEQQKITRGFRLLSGKPRMMMINVADDETDRERFACLSEPDCPVMAISARLESELMDMSSDEAEAFLDEMGLTSTSRDTVLTMMLSASGQTTFLTAGEKELRTWLMPKGGTALDAAGAIHTDMVKGFIRAEVMQADDLIRLGSERAVKAENLVRREPKDYVVKDGDILLFHFS